ncbi:head-tail connector protein [Aestuariivirga sp.]|uniref:head-tail connector protein n=1 Tax=Aestuariivirga sp. TaxID=2650926 RepID=UPI003BAC4796
MIVSLDALRAHLNITGEHDDKLLERKLEAAHVAVENFTGLNFSIAFTPWLPEEIDLETDEVTTPEVESNAPAPLKEGVLQFAAHLFTYREGQHFEENTPSAAPLGVFDLLAPYRAWSF